jgi:hypothetical protein
MENDMPTAQATFAPGTSPRINVNADWIRPFTEAPAKFYAGVCKEALSRTANRFQVQADYFKQLAECDTPCGLLACNNLFIQRSAALWFQEVERAFESLRRFPSEN